MKTIFAIAITLFGFTVVSSAQTAHEIFMTSKIKTNVTGDFNTWIHGDNTFSTETSNDWNNWNFAYMGLEGRIESQNAGDFSSWIIAGSDITVTNADGNFMNWVIEGEDRSVTLMTTNWNTWVINGSLTSGISTIVTDDFAEWEINGGNWTGVSPNFRAATVFISVFSSSVLQQL